jgi:single-stranded-DNA-specific exonuclease
VLAGWLRKLEPLGHGNPEPIFVARRVRLVTAPRVMKERHIRLELAQESALAASSASMRAVGWDLAGHVAALRLAQGSLVDVAYRIRENDHPQYGGLEVEIAGIRLYEEDSEHSQAHD